jgi:hypothetical protein
VQHPAEKGFEVELIGEIAAMVDLSAQYKKAGPAGVGCSRSVSGFGGRKGLQPTILAVS